MVACVSKGRPRQFWLMKENKRCSILFHLLVPVGRWQMWRSRPPSLANCCSSHFHRRTRLPLLPPLSAVISNEQALGQAGRRRVEACFDAARCVDEIVDAIDQAARG